MFLLPLEFHHHLFLCVYFIFLSIHALINILQASSVRVSPPTPIILRGFEKVCGSHKATYTQAQRDAPGLVTNLWEPQCLTLSSSHFSPGAFAKPKSFWRSVPPMIPFSLSLCLSVMVRFSSASCWKQKLCTSLVSGLSDQRGWLWLAVAGCGWLTLSSPL